MSHIRPLLLLLLCSAPATAADLSRIDRTIAKEPTYQAKPRYCLLVFGPQAETKVWLVVDGDALYVDRNANGDLTGDDKKVPRGKGDGPVPGVFRCGDIVLAGKIVCRGLTVRASSEEGDTSISIYLHGTLHAASVDTDGFLEFADSPSRAPIVHFDGPLTMAPVPNPEIIRTATRVKQGDRFVIIQDTKARAVLPTLVRGDLNAELKVALGTPGLGKGTFARIYHKDLPNEIQPVAELEFPNREPAKGAIKVKLTLPERC